MHNQIEIDDKVWKHQTTRVERSVLTQVTCSTLTCLLSVSGAEERGRVAHLQRLAEHLSRLTVGTFEMSTSRESLFSH